MRSIYGNASGRGGSCGAVATGWNREHLWAKSYGIDDDVVCNLAYTDLRHLRPHRLPHRSRPKNLPLPQPFLAERAGGRGPASRDTPPSPPPPPPLSRTGLLPPRHVERLGDPLP